MCKFLFNMLFFANAYSKKILNKKNICNIKINPDITEFFNKNIDFVTLKDKDNKNYEIPSVVYAGKEHSKINFTYVFGITKSDNNLLFGPYYYFTNLKNAIKQGIWSENNVKYNKGGGIVRFAIFTGLSKVILNNTEDSSDQSDIKRELISNENNLYDNLTLRITDYDGKWAENYDSIYIGDIELDTGEKMKN